MDAVLAAVRHVSVLSPAPEHGGLLRAAGRVIRWGDQVELRPLGSDAAGECAGYIAKYATKSTERSAV